jgi:hypothetical protein
MDRYCEQEKKYGHNVESLVIGSIFANRKIKKIKKEERKKEKEA